MVNKRKATLHQLELDELLLNIQHDRNKTITAIMMQS